MKEFPNIEMYMKVNVHNSSIYSIDFSPDEKYVAISLDKGTVEIYSLKNKKEILSIPIKPGNDAITNVKWRTPTSRYKTKNIFSFSTSKGLIESYHLNT